MAIETLDEFQARARAILDHAADQITGTVAALRIAVKEFETDSAGIIAANGAACNAIFNAENERFTKALEAALDGHL